MVQDDAVAFHRGHKRQPNAGVAAGGLNQHRLTRLDLPSALGRLDHGEADAVLHARCRVGALQLGQHRAPQPSVTR